MQANVEQIEQDIQNFKKQLKIERNLSEHTLRAYECDLHCMLRWIETYHIRALNDKVTMSYFNYLQDEEHLGARSIRRKYVSLRQFFEFLERRMMFTKNSFGSHQENSRFQRHSRRLWNDRKSSGF